MKLSSFWAKSAPFQSVCTHGYVCGKVAQSVFKQLLPMGFRQEFASALNLDEISLCSFVGYLVSVHDIGKLEYSFQMQNAGFVNKFSGEIPDGIYIPGVRHEKTGQLCLRFLWNERGENRVSSATFSRIIGAHHQGKTGNGHFVAGSEWYQYQKEFEHQMRRHFLGSCECILPEFQREKQGATGALLLGLLILADWISSGSVFEDAEEWIDNADAERIIETKTLEFLEKSQLKPIKVGWRENFCDVWTNIPANGLRPLQQEIQRYLNCTGSDPLLILVEAPMGEGKTEAGVYAALQMARRRGKTGFYTALPTAATSNQMVGRIQALMDMHNLSAAVRLLHGMSWLEDSGPYDIHSQDEASEVINWLVPTRRGLLGQFAVGTVDQAMLAATNVKYGVLRLLGLTSKALIIDEIHSYDAYMSEIIVRLLEWCKALEVPVVMLSATLPPAMKEKLLAPYTSKELSGEYPLITMVDQHGQVSEHKISGTTHRLNVIIRSLPILHNADRIAEKAVDEVKAGGCICVLMNTVREAQRVYTSIKNIFDGDLVLFHAQFPAGQRADIEKTCIQRFGKDKEHRPKQSILVATQVVEQSLDVDFDAMITAIAPIDLLIQRIGRVFRHDDTPRPEGCNQARVTVLLPEDNGRYGASAYVYPECLLNSSARIIRKTDMIRIPEDIAELVNEGYDPTSAPPDEARLWMENQVKEQVEAGASQQYLLAPPDKTYPSSYSLIDYEDDVDSQYLSAKTRLGEPTVRIALLSREEMHLLEPCVQMKNGMNIAVVKNRETAEMVVRNSVSVRCSRLGEEQSVFSYIKGDSLVSGIRIYPAEDGICRTNNGKNIRFDSELGLLIEDGEK